MDFAKFSGSESQILEKSQNEKRSWLPDCVQSDQKKWNFSKSEHFWFFDDFRDRCPAWLGINNVLEIVYLRLGNVTETGNAHDFSWDDHGFVFLRRWKTHFCFFFISKICNAILLWQQWWKNVEFTKKYQTHRNSKQNRVVKKLENQRKTSKIKNNI